jgi:hypothetical protein
MRIGNLSNADLTAQHNLGFAMARLGESLIRLGTMQRINRGSDDPAGLIGANQIQAELTALEKLDTSLGRTVGVLTSQPERGTEAIHGYRRGRGNVADGRKPNRRPGHDRKPEVRLHESRLHRAAPLRRQPVASARWSTTLGPWKTRATVDRQRVISSRGHPPLTR